jgi:hypothetical protein
MGFSFFQTGDEKANDYRLRGSRHYLNSISFKFPSGKKFCFVTAVLVTLGPGVYSDSNRNEYQKHKNNVSGSKAAAGP